MSFKITINLIIANVILISLCNKEKKEKLYMLYFEPGHEKTCLWD